MRDVKEINVFHRGPTISCYFAIAIETFAAFDSLIGKELGVSQSGALNDINTLILSVLNITPLAYMFGVLYMGFVGT